MYCKNLFVCLLIVFPGGLCYTGPSLAQADQRQGAFIAILSGSTRSATVRLGQPNPHYMLYCIVLYCIVL